MSKLKNLTFACVLLYALLPPQPASAVAPSTFTMFHSGMAFIGVIGTSTWVGVSVDGGTSCQQWLLISSNSNLKNNWSIYGTEGIDFIWAVDAPTFFCGFSMTPFNHDGFLLSLVGNGGNDIINGGNTASTMGGVGGHDSLEGRRANLTVFGNSGADTILTSSSSATISGGTGDDIVCVTNASRQVSSMFGNENDTTFPGDRRCGMGSSASTTVGFETAGCQSPCF